MTEEKDFLIKRLNEWCQQFDGIHIRYAYDENTEYHIVEVEPESIRRGNKQYKEAELALWLAFMEKFPESDLLICEPSDANQMSNCLFDNKLEQTGAQMGETIWSDYVVFTDKVTSLSKRSAYAKSNQYVYSYDYSLAA